MPVNIQDKLVIGIASRALFQLDDSHQVFERQGLEAYAQYQIEHENDILKPGPAFYLVQKLLALSHPNTHEALVEVVLLSRNSADTGLRIFNSIQHYELPISRAAFTNGESPYQYVSAFSTHLFLSQHAEDVKRALEKGFAAAHLFPHGKGSNTGKELRIAFDGDAVLFSDESEKVFQQQGLESFLENESEHAHTPLQHGPFSGFLQAMHTVQKLFPADQCPIRTALVTARSAPAHERVIRTLRNWNIRIDEALFLGGLDKTAFLKAFKADIFFDDQHGHCQRAMSEIATAHVPHGVSN